MAVLLLAVQGARQKAAPDGSTNTNIARRYYMGWFEIPSPSVAGAEVLGRLKTACTIQTAGHVTAPQPG